MIPREAMIYFLGMLCGAGSIALFLIYGNPLRNSIIAISGYFLIMLFDAWQKDVDKLLKDSEGSS